VAPLSSRWQSALSARGRILGWSILLLATAMAATTIATHVLLVRGMNSRVSAELAHETGEFRALAARQGTAATRPGQVLALLRTRTRQAVLERDTALIGLMAGRIVATSTNYSPGALRASPTLLARWAGVTRPASGSAQLAGGPARYEAIPVGAAGHRGGGVFVAAVLTASDRARITDVAQTQLEVGAIALLLGSALAWLAAGRVLRPVRDTTDLARRITETDLSERIPARGRNEVSELAVTFNRMLDRLETALTAQRRFLADAGHELRTPITIIQGNLDTLPVTSPEDLQTLAIAADELARMTRMVEELTLLAASEQPDFLRRSATDLPDLTRTLLAKARALGDRPWALAGTADGVAVLDSQRITQAVMQLAANAAAHTPAGTAVEIGSAIEGEFVTFTVADRGPGIPPGSRDRVFERFARLDPRRTGGTGLGLSVVAAICAAHGGSAGVTSRPGGGAVFTVSVPCLSAGAAPARWQPSLKEALT
jgi:two-component system, OmpR family, sensor kinase